MAVERKYKQTWCEYLTPCPIYNKYNDPSGIFIGDYDCAHCEHCIEYKKGSIICTNVKYLEK